MVRQCRKAKGMVKGRCVSAKDGTEVSSTYMQLRNRRIIYVSLDRRSEKASSVVDNGVSSSNFSSCCASNEYRNAIVGDIFIDLKEERDGDDTETSTYRRSTKRKLFENLRDEEKMENSQKFAADCDSAIMIKSSEYCCSGRITTPTTEEKVKSTTEQPTEVEIEEFFVEAEKHLHDKFKKKYNFDFEMEKPLEGRYEWVKSSSK